jgi:hypothetical protein
MGPMGLQDPMVQMDLPLLGHPLGQQDLAVPSSLADPVVRLGLQDPMDQKYRFHFHYLLVLPGPKVLLVLLGPLDLGHLLGLLDLLGLLGLLDLLGLLVR